MSTLIDNGIRHHMSVKPPLKKHLLQLEHLSWVGVLKILTVYEICKICYGVV